MQMTSCMILAIPFMIFAQPIKHFENPLHIRDSVTIEIKNSFANSSVTETQNDAHIKFEVVNNANNANIAMGDNSNHTARLHSFGDKNMLNSTGSNTGGWNTKNTGTNLTVPKEKRAAEHNSTKVLGKRDQVNLNLIHGNAKTSNFTRSGNGNTVEIHIGNGDNIVNVTIGLDAESSSVEDSDNNNMVKIYIGR